MKWYLPVIFIFLLFIILGCSPKQEHAKGKPYHHLKKGFRNPPGSIKSNGFSLDFLWFLIKRPLVNPNISKGHKLDDKVAIKQFYDHQNKDSITWIGHMTAIIRLDKKVIAIDPWFTSWAVTIPPFGPRRVVKPGIKLKKLPQIDVVIISHNHQDHLDISTLEKLPNPEKITIISPLGVSVHFKHIKFKEVIELDWHKSKIINKIEYRALPVVHTSRRTLFDGNKTLWAGFSIKSSNGKKIFFCEADYGETYKEIGKKYGPFDVALIAAGPYSPRVVHKGFHSVPEKSVQIGLDIRSKNLIPIHWGTVVMGTEKFMEPGPLFKKEALKKGFAEKNIWIMKIGETRSF